MNKSLLFVVLFAISTLVAALPSKDGRKREGRAKHRGGKMPLLNDPKLCWPAMRNATDLKCCVVPDLFSTEELSTCRASFKSLGFGHAKQAKYQGRNKAARKQRDASDENGKKSNGDSNEEEGEGRRPGGNNEGMPRKLIKKACTLDCYFNSNNYYTATGGIDSSKVLAKMLANPNFTAEWTSAVTDAVDTCTTGADGFDISKMPTPPPAKKGKPRPKCNFKAMAFVGCVKRYLTINCAVSATTTSAQCTEIIDKLKECDPFYVPQPPRFEPPNGAQVATNQKGKVAAASNMKLSVNGGTPKAGKGK